MYHSLNMHVESKIWTQINDIQLKASKNYSIKDFTSLFRQIYMRDFTRQYYKENKSFYLGLMHNVSTRKPCQLHDCFCFRCLQFWARLFTSSDRLFPRSINFSTTTRTINILIKYQLYLFLYRAWQQNGGI